MSDRRSTVSSLFTRKWWLLVVRWQLAALLACVLLYGGLSTVVHLVANGVDQWSGKPERLPLGVVMMALFAVVYAAVPLSMMALPYIGVFVGLGWVCLVRPAVDRSSWKLLLVSAVAAAPGALLVAFSGGRVTSCLVALCCGTLGIWLPRRFVRALQPGVFTHVVE